MTFLVIILVLALAWALYRLQQYKDLANNNANVANDNLYAIGHNADIGNIMQALLIREVGPHKAAKLYIDALYANDATHVLEVLYKEAGLNPQDVEDENESDKKSITRLATANFENIADISKKHLKV